MNKLILLLFVSILSSNILSAQQPDLKSWESYQKDNYSITFPGDWQLDDSGSLGPIFFLYSPLSSDEDLFRENINLTIEDLSGKNINLKEYVSFSTEQIKAFINDCKIITNETISANKSPYQKMVYTGNMNNFKLSFVQVYRIVQEKAYVLTFTCETSQLEKYQQNAELVLESFELR